MQLDVNLLRVYGDGRKCCGGYSRLLHHLSGLAFELLEKFDFSPTVIMGLLLRLFLNKEDVVVALANEGVLDFLALQTHQDLVFLLLHLVGQWLLFLLLFVLFRLFFIIVSLTGCLLPGQVAF
jgi:hypothetical protein